jgi:hypothetical protein
VNEKGVQITTTDAEGNKSTAEGIFINKTPAAEIEGGGKLSGFDFIVNSSDEKSGTLDAGTYSYEGSGRQPDVVNALTQNGAFQYGPEKLFGNPKHSGELNFRFSLGAHPELRDYGPSPHLLVPNDPKAIIPVEGWNFHVDSHTGDVRHGACAWLGMGCQ